MMESGPTSHLPIRECGYSSVAPGSVGFQHLDQCRGLDCEKCSFHPTVFPFVHHLSPLSATPAAIHAIYIPIYGRPAISPYYRCFFNLATGIFSFAVDPIGFGKFGNLNFLFVPCVNVVCLLEDSVDGFASAAFPFGGCCARTTCGGLDPRSVGGV